MKSLNYWPWAIAFIFTFVVVAIILTFYFIMEKPLEYDTYFNGDFEYVKNNYLRVEKDSSAFNQKYDMAVLSDLKDGENILKIFLSEKGKDDPLQAAEIQALFTRPATNSQNISVGNLQFGKGQYASDSFFLTLKGKWSLELQIKIDGLKVYRSFEYKFPIKKLTK